jgi:PAS domain S-box-containing protein
MTQPESQADDRGTPPQGARSLKALQQQPALDRQRMESRLRLAMEHAGMSVWELDLLTGQTLPDPWATWMGYSPAELEPTRDNWRAMIHPDDLPRARAALAAYLDGRAPAYVCEYRVRVKSGEWRWTLDRGHIVEWDEAGRPTRMIGTDTDISDRKRDELALREGRAEYQELADRLQGLLRELDHRVRNNLANLCSLVTIYERSAMTVERFAVSIRGKLMAMSAVHEIIAAAGSGTVELSALFGGLARQMLSDDSQRSAIEVAGPPLAVHSRQASALAMIFQELLTNALKHGAFRGDGGAVSLTWRAGSADGELSGFQLQWRETGGPPPTAAASPGQGLKLIEGLAGYDLGGRCTFDFEPTGFSCVLDCA